jgi:hypothetical protein
MLRQVGQFYGTENRSMSEEIESHLLYYSLSTLRLRWEKTVFYTVHVQLDFSSDLYSLSSVFLACANLSNI